MATFQKLQLKKVRDEGNVQPAEIKDIQTLLKALDKHNYTELRDYNIILLILDTGIRTSELMSIKNEDYDPEAMSIVIRPDVAKTSRSRTLYLSAMTNTSLKKFLKVKPKEWEKWLFPTRDGKQLKANVLGRNFRKYCQRSGVKFTPYQIRHSFATFYLENGGDPNVFGPYAVGGKECPISKTTANTELLAFTSQLQNNNSQMALHYYHLAKIIIFL
jgi:integrase